MSLLSWVQGDRSPAAAARRAPANAVPQRPRPAVAPAQRRTPVPAEPPALAEELPLAEADLPAAWVASRQRLLLRAPRPVRPGQRVSAVVRSEGGVAIPLGGEVVEVGPGDAVEMAVDADRVGAVQRILASLAGRALRPRARPPRCRVSLPAVVSSSAVHAYMTAFSLSQGGCGLLWSGSRPSRGTVLQVRLGGGSRSAAFHARVAWASDESGALRVGLRFVVGQDGALQRLLAEARRDTAT